jgi:AbrB family looped-hinge helix DNA binding protein
MEDVLVTRKGQITVPVALRRKYGIKEGMKITVEDSGSKIVLNIIPRFEDLIGIDAEKKDIKTTIEKLDKMRSEDRY